MGCNIMIVRYPKSGLVRGYQRSFKPFTFLSVRSKYYSRKLTATGIQGFITSKGKELYGYKIILITHFRGA